MADSRPIRFHQIGIQSFHTSCRRPCALALRSGVGCTPHKSYSKYIGAKDESVTGEELQNLHPALFQDKPPETEEQAVPWHL